MRIAITSIPYNGRESFFTNIQKTWPNYKLEDLGFGNIYSTKLNVDDLTKEVDNMLNVLSKYTSIEDNVVISTSPIDLLVKIFFAIDDQWIPSDFLKNNIDKIKKMFDFIDVIFYLPVSKFNIMNIPNNISIDEYLDEKFLSDLENNIKNLFVIYQTRLKNPFFDVENCPAIIEIFGNDIEKIEIVKMYLDNNGKLKEPQIVLPKEDSVLVDQLSKEMDVELEKVIKEKEKIKKSKN